MAGFYSPGIRQKTGKAKAGRCDLPGGEDLGRWPALLVEAATPEFIALALADIAAPGVAAAGLRPDHRAALLPGRRDMRGGGDLQDQLAADRLEEGVEAFRHHDEGSRSADHAAFVVEVEILEDREAPGIDPAVHDRQAVDDDAGRQRLVTYQVDAGAVVVRTVAGDVQHAAHAPVFAAAEDRDGILDGAGNAGAPRGADRMLQQPA